MTDQIDPFEDAIARTMHAALTEGQQVRLSFESEAVPYRKMAAAICARFRARAPSASNAEALDALLLAHMDYANAPENDRDDELVALNEKKAAIYARMRPEELPRSIDSGDGLTIVAWVDGHDLLGMPEEARRRPNARPLCLLDQARQAIARRQIVPDGHIPLPINPTAAMHGAGDAACGKTWMGGKVWAAMVNAYMATTSKSTAPASVLVPDAKRG